MNEYILILQPSSEIKETYTETLPHWAVAPYLNGAYSVGAVLISIERVSE